MLPRVVYTTPELDPLAKLLRTVFIVTGAGLDEKSKQSGPGLLAPFHSNPTINQLPRQSDGCPKRPIPVLSARPPQYVVPASPT